MGVAHQQNISNPERVGRVVIGAAVVVLGIVVLAGGPTFWGIVGGLLAVAAGIDFVLTGARGYCPLYARLGHVPKSLGRATR